MREQALIEFVIRPYRDEDFEDVIENIKQGDILDPALDDREHFLLPLRIKLNGLDDLPYLVVRQLAGYGPACRAAIGQTP